MDSVKTKYVNHTTEYINTNIHKTTTNRTKYMRQLWNKVSIKCIVNVCFLADRVKHRKTFINAAEVDNAKFGNEAHFMSFAVIVASMREFPY